jgi:hypothetical protein
VPEIQARGQIADELKLTFRRIPPRRAALVVVLVAALSVYYVSRELLPDVSNWWDVAVIALLLMPATFGLVLAVLPLQHARGLLLVGLALVILAIALDQAHARLPANFLKLAAMTALGFAFLQLFESVSWVVLVACIIPLVDAYSVWRGPTQHIVKHQKHLFTTLSISFPVPGEHGAANLGLPDLLFFALFLAAAARFGLRVGWTWTGLMLSFGATMALAVGFEVAGLPALPLLSLAFLLPNADLLWRAVRPRPRPTESPPTRERAEAG